MSERGRSRSGSVASNSSYSTISSTTSAKQVGMNKVDRTSEKKMRVVAVNGCTSIHLFGANFIVGAHAEPKKIPIIARQAADLAGGSVTSIVVWAPDSTDGDRAETELRGRYPRVPISQHHYIMDNRQNPDYWVFEATQGNPGNVSAKHAVEGQ